MDECHRHTGNIPNRRAHSHHQQLSTISEDPTPAFAAQMGEACESLLRRLDAHGLRGLAVAKMEGYTNAEIAAQFGCCVSTVERRLQLIRRVWTEHGSEEENKSEAP